MILVMTITLIVNLHGQEFPLAAGFVLEGNPKVGEEFNLHFVAEAVYGNVPTFRFSIEIPAGIEVLSDTTSFIVELAQGDSMSYPFKIRTVREGAYQIKGTLQFTESEVKLFTEYYIISQQDTSFHNSERFEEYIYNTGGDTIPEIPKSYEPSDNVTVSGTLRYYDNDEQCFVPIRGISVKVFRMDNTFYYETTTNDNGQYSLQPSPGRYYILFYAKTSAGEVHPFWDYGTNWIFWAKLYVSPLPHYFEVIFINTETPGNYVFSYDFTSEGRPEWAKILRTISEIKSKVFTSTGGQTLDYIEVSYPTHAIGSYEPEDPFYAPAGMILEASVKILFVWYGFEIIYRNPHQIVLPDQSCVWGVSGKQIMTHEWGHAFMTECIGRKMPHGWDFRDHWWSTVSNQGFAFSEGFGDFLAGAVWINELGTQLTNPSTQKLEPFYVNSHQPWYKGENFNNTDGRIVEGALMQFFWDIFDNRYTNDHTQNIDDDGVGENNLTKITTALVSTGTIMCERTSDWIYLPPEDPQVRFAVKEGYFNTQDTYNFSGKFKEKWHQQSPNVDELYNVVIHPFNYLNPYPVPAPTNLTGSTTHNSAMLIWTDNALNEGQYFVYRQRQGENWQRLPTILGPNTTSFTNTGLDYCTQYSYKVRALTCDTSNYSNEISIRTKYFPVFNFQASHQQDNVRLNWTNPTQDYYQTIIVRKEGLSGITWSPTDGQTYSVGNSVDDAIVVYVGTGNSFNDNISNSGAPYYYKAFAYNSQNFYSIGTHSLAILPYNDIAPLTGPNNITQIISRGRDVHLVFVGRMNPDDLNDKIIYRFSSDGGNNWTDPVTIVDVYGNSPIYPTIALDSEGRPHILWAGWAQVSYGYTQWRWDFVCYHTYKNGNDWMNALRPVLLEPGDISSNPDPPFPPPSAPFLIRGDSGICSVIFPNSLKLETFKFYLYESVQPPQYRHKNILFSDISNISPNEEYVPNRPSLTIDGNRVVVCYNKRINNVDRLTIRWGEESNNVIIPYSYSYNPHIILERQNIFLLALFDANDASIKISRCMWENNNYTLTNQQQVYYDALSPFCLPLPSPRIVNSSLVVFHGTLEPYSKIFLFYSQRSGNNWITTNLLNPAVEVNDNIFPQAYIVPNNIYLSQMLKIYWSKKTVYNNNARYSLMNKEVNLPNYYVTCDMATGPNNGVHLDRVPNSKELCMVFQEQNQIYSPRSNDEGENWETEDIDNGLYPCVGLNYRGLPWIAYCKDGDLLCKIKRDDDSWKEIIIYDGDENHWAGPPSMQLATMPIKEDVIDYAYITYPVYNGTMPDGPGEQPPSSEHSYIYVSLFDTTGIDIVTHLIDEGPAEAPVSHPCVSVTPADLIHICWQRESEIWYITNTGEVTPENWRDVEWTPTYNISDTKEPSEHPFVEAYGDEVFAVWSEGETGEIIRRPRIVKNEYNKWGDLENVSNTPDFDSDYPQMSTREVILWQEQGEDSCYKVYTNVYGEVLCLTPEANDISYVHTNVLIEDPQAPQITVYYCYTDEITENELYEVKFDKFHYPDGIVIPPPEETSDVKYYEGKLGEELASTYCEQRTGYINYGNFKIDYDNNHLKYKLKYLNPCKKYLLQAVLYQCTTATIHQKLDVEDTLASDNTLSYAIPETISFFIRPNSYKNDMEAKIKINKIQGAFSVLSKFKLYEYETIDSTGGSGPQSSGTERLPIPAMLYSPKPNPFNNRTEIKFQIPVRTDVELKVYNSTGRLVKTIVDEHMKPGIYNLTWDGKDNQNRIQSKGIYFVRLRTNDYSETKKIVMVK
jgi:hypothetical protein